MKKKFRRITIDNENWSWSFYTLKNYYGTKKLKIWKNRKLVYKNIFSHEYGSSKNYKIKMIPKKISKFIKIFLKNV